MQQEYTTIYSPAEDEFVERKSRFIGHIAPVQTEEEAQAFIAQIRQQHRDATHNTYAYILRSGIKRYSDDGEPQGTAGMPILGVLKAKELRETAVAVVRYFGGIKLGAGGLTRAYASLAAEGVEGAKKVLYTVCRELLIETDYPEVDPLLRFFGAKGTMVLMKEFGARALFTVAVKEADAEAFRAEVTELLLGRVDILEGESYFRPFPVE